MFIKSIHSSKRQSIHESISYDQNMRLSINQLRESNLSKLNPQHINNKNNLINNNMKTLFKLRFDNLKQICTNNHKSIKKDKIIRFENDYLKSLADKNFEKNNVQKDQRKEIIKEKIKDKIKLQIASLNKNIYINHSQLLSSSMRQIKPKPQIIFKDQNKKVSIKGNSIPRQLRMSLSQKISDSSKANYYRKHVQTAEKKPINKQFTERLMTSTPVSPISIFKKGRRSLSNAIKIYVTENTKNNQRNIHSALGLFKQNNSKDQLQIQPWDYTEQF